MKPGMLTIHQLKKDDTDGELSSIDDQLTAWNRYVPIYCIKYQHGQSKLAKHLEAARDIADTEDNWYSQDKDFRAMIKQSQVVII